VRPSRFILTLDDAAVVADPPPQLRRLQARGLEIWHTEDLGPHKKYYPYVASIPSHTLPLATADDDVLYPVDWLERLLAGAAAAGAPEVICHRARRIDLLDTQPPTLAPYLQWDYTRPDEASVLNTATGVGGSIEASGSNSSGAAVVGGRARIKCYVTGGTPGGENARAWLQGYSAGAYGPPFVIFEKGSPGYQSALGAGGTISQATDKATTVVLNTTTGQITMNAASLAANTTVAFTLTNSVVAALDILHIKHTSGGTLGAYRVEAFEAAGSASVRVTNITAGALAEAVVLKFYIFKTTTS